MLYLFGLADTCCFRNQKATMVFFVFQFLLLLGIFVAAAMATNNVMSAPINHNSFPPDFIFGVGSSAYQFEGAAKEGGRGPSIWDTFTHNNSEKITDRSNGDVALDFYHRYKEDIKLMKSQGFTSLKFSISWSRILPYGKLSKGVNKEGIAFYNDLINELLANGIEPFAVMFHYDLPQALEDEYQGFLGSPIVDDFRDYADLCFNEFGDRIKYWITINEPFSFAVLGYFDGTYAPGRCSVWMGCPAGNSGTEPYIVGHNMLLAHAKATQLYRHKHMTSQKGKIGITMFSNWFEPYSESEEDAAATQRAIDFMFGWFMDPLTYGDYPASMHELARNRLPKFTTEEAEMVKGSYDFLGLNYYSSNYVQYIYSPPEDMDIVLTNNRRGIPIGEPTSSNSIFIVPRDLREMLVYTKKNYKNPLVYVTENGMSDSNVNTIQQGLDDSQRIDYMRRHLLVLRAALQDGVNVKGYFAWSLLDNFEWKSGYIERFGINYVDYTDNLKRYPKRSALWLKAFLLTGENFKFDS